MSLVTGLLIKRCDIRRQSFASDGKGGILPSGASVLIAAGVLCLIDRRDEKQMEREGGRQNFGTHVAYFEWDHEADIRPNDILTNVQDAVDPTKTEVDVTTDTRGTTTTFLRQYRVLDRWDSNGERDHLECALELMKGMAQP